MTDIAESMKERATSTAGDDDLVRWSYFFAFLFVALALGPGLAHLLEMPNKMRLAMEEYFIVQEIYRGWELLGIVVIGALLTTLFLAFVLRGDRVPTLWAAAANACIVATQVIFWTLTYPMNAATDQWALMPPNWEAMRVQWELSHAVSAILTLCALLALVRSVLVWGSERSSAP